MIRKCLFSALLAKPKCQQQTNLECRSDETLFWWKTTKQKWQTLLLQSQQTVSQLQGTGHLCDVTKSQVTSLPLGTGSELHIDQVNFFQHFFKICKYYYYVLFFNCEMGKKFRVLNHLYSRECGKM